MTEETADNIQSIEEVMVILNGQIAGTERTYNPQPVYFQRNASGCRYRRYKRRTWESKAIYLSLIRAPY